MLFQMSCLMLQQIKVLPLLTSARTSWPPYLSGTHTIYTGKFTVTHTHTQHGWYQRLGLPEMMQCMPDLDFCLASSWLSLTTCNWLSADLRADAFRCWLNIMFFINLSYRDLDFFRHILSCEGLFYKQLFCVVDGDSSGRKGGYIQLILQIVLRNCHLW